MPTFAHFGCRLVVCLLCLWSGLKQATPPSRSHLMCSNPLAPCPVHPEAGYAKAQGWRGDRFGMARASSPLS